MQAARFEMKYLVNDTQIEGIRRYLRGRLVLDENNDPSDLSGYTVCSLYLDGPRFQLYNQTMQGSKNRFKLRIRLYDNNPDAPAFLEIKRRETDIIKKKRAAIKKSAALQILQGAHPSPTMLFKKNGDMDALDRFCRLTRNIDAGGAAYVVYKREAYVSPGSDHVRVTFDRELYGGYYRTGSELMVPETGIAPKWSGCVLEMKFTDRFPDWMNEVAQIFGLQRTSVPKYVMCVDALGILEGGAPKPLAMRSRFS
jgi:hypothetical protein